MCLNLQKKSGGGCIAIKKVAASWIGTFFFVTVYFMNTKLMLVREKEQDHDDEGGG